MSMEFRLLGGLEVVADGVVVRLGDLRERKVLAVLALEAGRSVPLPRLVDAVWEDDPPGTAVRQVQNAVSRLRRKLDGRQCSIVSEGGGYRLAVPSAAVDARVFEARAEEARLAASAGRIADAVELLRSALDQWRGPFLDGLPGMVFAAAAVAWEERRRAAQDAYYDQMLAQGRHQEITGELAGLSAADRLRENIAVQLMLALYRSGRPQDALGVFRDTRAALTERLGLDPGLELRTMQQRILARDPALALQPGDARPVHYPVGGRNWRSEVTERDAAVPAMVPRQLPAAMRYFAGRRDELKALSEELAQLTDSLDAARADAEAGEATGTVVISAVGGTAGAGKTALAVHWAHQVSGRFPDGQLYVNMRGFGPSGQPAAAAEALHGFLAALGVSADQVPAGLEAQAALYRSVLAGKRVIILVDNARDAAQVRPLLPATPSCMVIVTSRSQLTSLVTVDGARPITLGLLSAGESLDLLARRLGSGRIGREPDAAADIVELCSGLPLALAIVGGRASVQPDLPLASLVVGLRDAGARLDMLTAEDPLTDVRTVFSWSYQLLRPDTARLFRMLGIHPGPDISLPAAASLAGAPVPEASRALRELTAANLVTEHATGRYACHDLLRAYAAEQAETSDSDGDRQAARHRVLDHYLHTACAASRLLNPHRPDLFLLAKPSPGVSPEELRNRDQAVAWFEREHKVLLAVTALATDIRLDSHSWQLPVLFAMSLNLRGRWYDWAESQRTALTAAERLGDQPAQARTHRELGLACARIGDFQEADAHMLQALAMYQRLGDRAGEAQTHFDQSYSFERQGRYTEALRRARCAVELAAAAGADGLRANALNRVGWTHALLGDFAQSLATCLEAISLNRAAANPYGEAAAWDSVGYAQHHLGRYTDAIASYEQALRMLRSGGDLWSEAETLAHLGDSHDALGDGQAASAAWHQALAILEELQLPGTDALRVKLAAAS